MIPGISGMLIGPAAHNARAGTQRQVTVPTPMGPVYVNISAAADKQYLVGAYINEQGR